MMEIKKKYIAFPLMMCTLLSCMDPMQDNESAYNKEIAFQVHAPEESYTKAEVKDPVQFINLFATDNGANMFTEESKKMDRPASGTIWILTGGNSSYTWTPGHSYTFYAYTHSEVTDQDSYLRISNAGKTIDVKQPTDYTQTIDYLLSYHITEPAAESHAVIPIRLEHAMAKVSICVTRAESMRNVSITDLRLKVNNVKLVTNMSCLEMGEWKNNSATPNVWTNKLGAQTTNYELVLNTDEEVSAKVPTRDMLDWKTPTMSFIANPVDKSGLTDYAISLSYNVTANNEDGQPETHSYSRTFALQEITPQWENSHIIRYLIHIDNGIHLTGSIREWKNVDYIEGTILPPIANEDK